MAEQKRKPARKPKSQLVLIEEMASSMYKASGQMGFPLNPRNLDHWKLFALKWADEGHAILEQHRTKKPKD